MGTEPPPAQALPHDAEALAARVSAGDRRALARAISLVENGDAAGSDVLTRLYPSTGAARFVGITGAPGVGKSSLAGAMVAHIRATEDARVGVISVDPSSPFTRGALLGDRIRLSEHFLDPEVFIRSMGSRGHLGGLAETSLQAAFLLDAYGAKEILLETVGVGQSEVEIARIADTVLLVLVPGSGDSVQALKAGIMEIPDIIVINKADHPGAHELRQHVRSILTLAPRDWVPPILETQAHTGEGVPGLWDKILEHRDWMGEEERFEQRRRANLEAEVFSLTLSKASQHLEHEVRADPQLRALLDAMHAREIDPVTCMRRLFHEVFR